MMVNFLQPGLIMIVAGLLLLIVPETLRKVVVLGAPVVTAYAVVTSATDKLTLMVGIIFSAIAIIAAIYNLHVKDKYELAAEAVYAGSSISVIFATHWIGMLIFWELMAVASWLIVISGRTEKATKAGFRYLLVHMLGGNLLLAGIVMKIHSGSALIECLTGQQDLAFWLILLGVAVNAAIPPLNAWIADAYPESTMGGTVYMASYTTKVGVFCLIKLFAGTEFLLYFGVFMAVWGACMALIENDLRRLFSYHIISQLGYMVAALAIGGASGIDGASAHLFNNILYKGTLFMCSGVLIAATGKRKISELGGLGKKMPITATCFAIASMAIAGFPLLNGFVSKSVVMNTVAESGCHWAELLLMLASVGTLMSITLKINYFVFWGKSDNNLEVNENMVPLNRKIAMILGAAGCVITGVFPGIVYGLSPFGTDGHPFTVDHITQYIQLFAGAIIVFVMYLEHMMPKAKITLDTDWFYRKPLKYGVLYLSKFVDSVRLGAGEIMNNVVEKGKYYLVDHYHLLDDLFGIKRPEFDGMEDDDVLNKPIGIMLTITSIFFVIVIAYIFIKY